MRSFAFVVALGLSGCSAFSLYPYGRTRMAGALESRGGELGDFTFVPDRCSYSAWNAVDWSSPEGTVMRLGGEVTTNDAGTEVGTFVLRIARPDAPGGPREVVLRAADCPVFFAYAHWFSRDGAIRFECASPEGGTLSGYASFMGCS